MKFRIIVRAALLAACLMTPAACSEGSQKITAAEKAEVADSIRNLVTRTYDLGTPEAVERLMSIYPDTGAVLSTSSGHISKTRAELERQIRTFWQYVGSNMRNPKWEWTSMHVEVLAPDAAVLTASYRIPHLTPRNTPHVIAGAWTAAFVKRNGRWMVIQEHLSDVPVAPAAAAGQPEDHTGH